MNEDEERHIARMTAPRTEAAAAAQTVADAIRDGAKMIADAIREDTAHAAVESLRERSPAMVGPCEPGSVVGATCRRGTTGCPLAHDDDD